MALTHSKAIFGGLAMALVVGVVSTSALRATVDKGGVEAAQQPITFSKDIAPIFQEKCQVCHQPNSIAPMSLLNYADAKKYASAIKTKVAARVMPPWHIDKSIGVRGFKNDRSLSEEQISRVVSWVDAG